MDAIQTFVFVGLLLLTWVLIPVLAWVLFAWWAAFVWWVLLIVTALGYASHRDRYG